MGKGDENKIMESKIKNMPLAECRRMLLNLLRYKELQRQLYGTIIYPETLTAIQLCEQRIKNEACI